MMISRRHLLTRGAAFSLGFAGLHALLHGSRSFAQALRDDPDEFGLGPLQPDPQGLLDLPPGFSARVISRAGEEMADGLLVPGRPDGMATFPGPDGTCIIICNHELSPTEARLSPFGADGSRLGRIDPTRLFDSGRQRLPGLGGTTTLIFDPRERKVLRQFLSLAGTNRNCAGGPMPWNAWLTCEEDVSSDPATCDQPHGWVFEVPAAASPGLTQPTPIKAMGRFNHEAVAIDPASGIIYLTEDRPDGLLYRFVPTRRHDLGPGVLQAGGKLQALMVRGSPSLDTRNWNAQRLIQVSSTFDAQWIDLEEVESPKDDLREQGFARGAARFARGEGMWWGKGSVYFACTNGGMAKCGQIWRYTPSAHEGTPDEARHPGTLELFVQPDDAAVVKNADNLTVAPWGDLVVCEDSDGQNRLLGVTPAGKVYPIARNRLSTSELAGVTFTPDGSTLLVNIQHNHLTLAIQGPWRK